MDGNLCPYASGLSPRTKVHMEPSERISVGVGYAVRMKIRAQNLKKGRSDNECH